MVIVIEDAAGSGDWSTYGLSVTARWENEPSRADVRAALRDVDSDGVLVSGTAATLNTVVEGLRRADRLDAPVGFLAALPQAGAADPLIAATTELVDNLALHRDPAVVLDAAPMPLMLVRNEVGGVLLARMQLEAPRLAKFGAQAYHDDQLIADGPIRGLTVTPEYGEQLSLRATVTPASGRKRSAATHGRAVQVACDPVQLWVDGRDCGEIEGRTWYVDDRERWLLRGAKPGAGGGADRRTPRFWDRLRRR